MINSCLPLADVFCFSFSSLANGPIYRFILLPFRRNQLIPVTQVWRFLLQAACFSPDFQFLTLSSTFSCSGLIPNSVTRSNDGNKNSQRVRLPPVFCTAKGNVRPAGCKGICLLSDLQALNLAVWFTEILRAVSVSFLCVFSFRITQ